jgi:hypothetical protein
MSFESLDKLRKLNQVFAGATRISQEDRTSPGTGLGANGNRAGPIIIPRDAGCADL